MSCERAWGDMYPVRTGRGREIRVHFVRGGRGRARSASALYGAHLDGAAEVLGRDARGLERDAHERRLSRRARGDLRRGAG